MIKNTYILKRMKNGFWQKLFSKLKLILFISIILLLFSPFYRDTFKEFINIFSYFTITISLIYILIIIFVEFEENYGTITFDDDKLIIKEQNETIYFYSQLDNLEIGLIDYKGEIKYDISFLYKSKGTNNYVKIKDKKYNFLIENIDMGFTLERIIDKIVDKYTNVEFVKK